MYAVPAIFTPTDSRPVVLFDGTCNLCNFGVQLVLDYDSCTADDRGNLRVAALQSEVGRVLLERLDGPTRDMVLRHRSEGEGGEGDDGEEEEEDDYKSIVVCGPDRTWVNTAAVLKLGRSMQSYPRPFRPLALLAYLIPPFLRNRIYGMVSRRRKRWFGERAECRLWDDNWDARFVDDAVLGGRSSGGGSDDPFRDPSAPPSDEDEEGKEEGKEEKDVRAGDAVRIVAGDANVVVVASPPGMGEYFPRGLCLNGCVGRVVDGDGDGDGVGGAAAAAAAAVVVEFDADGLAGEGGKGTGIRRPFKASIDRSQMVKIL